MLLLFIRVVGVVVSIGVVAADGRCVYVGCEVGTVLDMRAVAYGVVVLWCGCC